MSDPVDLVFSSERWVSVYGVGHVGLSLIAVYLRHGLRVIGIDIDKNKLRSIREGKFRFSEKEIKEAIVKGLSDGRLVLTTDGIKASKESVIKVVTVPVFIDWITKEVSYEAIKDVSKKIALGLKKGDLVIIESSVPPGTTEEVVKPILEGVSGLVVERDFYLAYSPERIYVGRAVKDIEENYPKIVSGVGPRSLELVSKFYERIAKKGVIKLSTVKAAEFEKLAEGIYRDVNIALANELALAAMRLGIDYYEVREAANSQPYCHLHLPGPGVGGPCIPIYPYFMMVKVSSKGFRMELTRLARRINEEMPRVVTSLVMRGVKKYGIDVKGCKLAILGLAFRGDVEDTRLSPAHEIIELLTKEGFKNIVVHDPLVKYDRKLSELGVKLSNDLSEVLKDSDVVVVLTRHSAYRGLKVSELIKLSGREPLIVDAVSYLLNDVGYGKVVYLGRA